MPVRTASYSHVLVRHAVGMVQLGVSSTFEHLLLLDALFLEFQRSFARTLQFRVTLLLSRSSVRVSHLQESGFRLCLCEYELSCLPHYNN